MLNSVKSRQSVEFIVVFLAGILLGGVLAASLLLFQDGDLKESIVAVQAALVPAIALLASYIAYRQARNAELKRKHELYEMRLETFHALRDLIISVQKKDALDLDELADFNKRTADSLFLFDEGIDEYLDQVRSKAQELYRLEESCERAKEREDPGADEICEEAVGASIWLAKQLEEAKLKFTPFLKLE